MSAIRAVDGDLWDYHHKGFRVVVTTNIGWDPKTYRNNMGAGVALQAAARFPELPCWYGKRCSKMKTAQLIERADLRLIFFPVKPLLDPKNPEISWNQKGNIGLISCMLVELDALAHSTLNGQPIAMSYPGCGNGGLDVATVEPMVTRQLGGYMQAGKVVLVRYARDRQPGFGHGR